MTASLVPLLLLLSSILARAEPSIFPNISYYLRPSNENQTFPLGATWPPGLPPVIISKYPGYNPGGEIPEGTELVSFFHFPFHRSQRSTSTDPPFSLQRPQGGRSGIYFDPFNINESTLVPCDAGTANNFLVCLAERNNEISKEDPLGFYGEIFLAIQANDRFAAKAAIGRFICNQIPSMIYFSIPCTPYPPCLGQNIIEQVRLFANNCQADTDNATEWTTADLPSRFRLDSQNAPRVLSFINLLYSDDPMRDQTRSELVEQYNCSAVNCSLTVLEGLSWFYLQNSYITFTETFAPATPQPSSSTPQPSSSFSYLSTSSSPSPAARVHRALDLLLALILLELTAGTLS